VTVDQEARVIHCSGDDVTWWWYGPGHIVSCVGLTIFLIFCQFRVH
jgi:hypothetical protein